MSQVTDKFEKEERFQKQQLFTYGKLLLNLLWIKEEQGVSDIYLDDIFPDYQPKLSEDKCTDYMPSVATEIQAIPAATLHNLPILLKLFRLCKKDVRKNPGKWVDGNIVLGANPKEYEPSKPELLLDEMGERIQSIISEVNADDVRNLLKQDNIRTRKISYRHFTFIHMDVMGSGRFFYVKQIEEKTVKLR
jgi:hypothetical protein